MTDWTLEREQAAQARCDAATKGEWRVRVGGFYMQDGERMRQLYGADLLHVAFLPEAEQLSANEQFIIHARTDLPAALAEIRRLRDRVQSLESVLRSIEFGCEPGNCPACGGRDVGRGNCHASHCIVDAALNGATP